MRTKAFVRIEGRDKERTVYEKNGINYVRYKGEALQVWLRSDGENYADYQWAWYKDLTKHF